MKVYCDAHDERVHAVLPCKWMAKGRDVKLHFLCAVNPVHGPVLIKMTSGTTDNIDQAGNLNAPYHVSTAANVQGSGVTSLEHMHPMQYSVTAAR